LNTRSNERISTSSLPATADAALSSTRTSAPPSSENCGARFIRNGKSARGRSSASAAAVPFGAGFVFPVRSAAKYWLRARTVASFLFTPIVI
jgi:hypothetical protein